MTTTIFKKLTGVQMAKIFDEGTEDISIRYYKATDVEDEEFTPEASYIFEIIVRHPENTDANVLFDEALNNL